MNTATVAVICGVAGLAAGWALTIVVARVPDRSPLGTRSRCDQCGHPLTGRELVPIVSWLAQRNRCRTCTQAIGLTPLAIELTTPGLFVAVAIRLGADPAVPAFCLLAAALVALAAIDLRHHRLPREITYPALAVGAILLTIAAVVDDDTSRLVDAGIGAGAALAGLWLVHLASRGDLGAGDVRLAPLLGLYLGYIGLINVPVGLFAGFALGSLVGVALVAAGRSRRAALPFGPFLAAGTLATILVTATGALSGAA